MNKVLSFTGGSTQGVGLSAVGVGIMEHYKPNIIIGESVSAIFAIPLAMGENELLENAMMSFNKKDIFGKYQPLNKKDSFPSIRGLLRIISCKPSLGTQYALVDYIKKYITPLLFRKWKQECSVDVIVATANYRTGTLNLFDLRRENYDSALSIILASCNIPVLIDGIKLGWSYHYDGGVIKANPGIDYLKTNADRISDYYSVWNRSNYSDSIKKLEDDFYYGENVLQVAKRTLKMMIANQSLDNEIIEDLICNKYNINHKKYFFETDLDSLYDTDIIDKLTDWHKGLEIGRG